MDIDKTYENIDDLITDYFIEGLDKDDLDRLNQWIKLSQENEKYFQHLQEIWFSSITAEKAKRFSGQAAYGRFLQRTSGQKELPKQKKANLQFKKWYAVASVTLLFIISYGSYWLGEKHLSDRFAKVTIEAPLGSRAKMYLPDGSLVWLNCGSMISYSQGFGVNDREINLSGEGYFEVVKNEKLPFSVRTKELQVEVLGTKFNLRNYPEDEEATVSLLEGKVLVSNNLASDKNIHLYPNQKVFLNKFNGEMRVIEINAQHTVEWTNGYLFFDEELLPDIVKELERNYNVEFIIEDKSLESFRFYGNFVLREYTIEEILQILAGTNKIKYKIEGKKIFLSSRI